MGRSNKGVHVIRVDCSPRTKRVIEEWMRVEDRSQCDIAGKVLERVCALPDEFLRAHGIVRDASPMAPER